MQAKTWKSIFIIIFVILFFSTRAHFYKLPLVGEEGIFAELLINQPKEPDFVLSARIDGENLYSAPRHPNMLYNSIKIAGIVASPFANYSMWQNDQKITPTARLIFSMFQFVILLAIAAYLALYNSQIFHFRTIIFLVVTVSPIAIFTSANLQIDGSVGVLMNGLFAITLLPFLSYSPKRSFNYILVFFATLFLSTGKQEWSVVLMVALGLTTLYIYFLRKKALTNSKPDYVIALIIFSGISVGHIISYYLSPQNYLGAFQVFWNFSRAEEILSGQIKIERWLSLTSLRLQWIFTLAGLTAISSLLIFHKRRQIKPIELLIWLYGMGLFGAYFISNWNPEPRYFAPALMILIIATIIMFPPALPKRLSIAISSLIVSMLISSVVFLYGGIVKVPLKPYFDAAEYNNLRSDQVAVLSTAKGWNKLDIDFINKSIGSKGIKKLANNKGKKLYPSVNQ